MDDPTPLDRAYAAMARDPEADGARLGFYGRLADGEMFVLLAGEARGGALTPRVFDLEGGAVVLIFDLEERLTAFTGGPGAYAALPGRVIAAQLAGQGIGLGINLGAPSEMLLPPDAVDWLAQTIAHAPDETLARPEAFDTPKGLPLALLDALGAKLVRAGGLAQTALLAAVTYEGGRRGHMLAFIGARPGAEAALARAAGEALTFSGVEAGEMDVAFVDPGTPVARAMARVARRFDLPEQVAPQATPAAATGADPARPPRLR